MSVDAEPAAAPLPSNPPAVSMEVGERPAPVEVSVPAGYEAAGGDLQIEVSDPHRAGEGMSKRVEYKVTYWSTLPGYTNVSGCVTRRYSDFEWLWKQLRATTDGIIVPSLPQKTLVANDDPTSAAIEASAATPSCAVGGRVANATAARFENVAASTATSRAKRGATAKVNSSCSTPRPISITRATVAMKTRPAACARRISS